MASAAITFGYVDPITGERCGPFPKQSLAHVCPADITFFGGAAGPGKSTFDVIEGSTTCLEYEGCEVALFRRKHTELERSLIPTFRRLVPKSLAKFNASKYCATFKNGSLLWFCHCQHESNVYDYQSAQWIELLVDESTHCTQFILDYLVSRVRSVVPVWRRRAILTSNPGNVGHGMHKRRFVEPPPEAVQEILLRYNHVTDAWEPPPYPEAFGSIVQRMDVWRPWPEPDDPTPPAEMMTRCFIPALLKDNPALERADPTYRTRIYAMGGHTAKQLAEGDWDASDTMVVGDVWRQQHQVTEQDEALLDRGVDVGDVVAWHVLTDPKWRPPQHATIYGAVDYGYGAPWAFYLTAVIHDKHTRTFWERYMPKKRDEEQAAMIRDDILRLKESCGLQTPDWIVCDPQMWNSREEMRMKSIAEIYMSILEPIGVRLLKGAAGRGARLSRPQRWKAALSVAPDGLPWWSCTTACPHLIRSVPEVPWDEEDPEVEDDDSENHAYEAMGRYFEARPHVPAAPTVDAYKHLDPLSRRYWQEEDRQAAAKKPRRVTAGALNILR